jgi:rhomboid family GlyGly-CTERM serine protease
VDSPVRLNTDSVPFVTLLLCGAALIVFIFPALQSALIYDRAAISSGEWWRLATGHLVHYSPSHFLFDVLAVFVTGSLIEVRRYRGFGWLCLLAAAASGVVLFIAVPQMAYYGGLSGIATAAVVYLCLHGLREVRAWSWLCAAVLAILTVKIGLELVLGISITMYATTQPFVPIPISHVVGAASALLAFCCFRTRSSVLTNLQLEP